MSLVLGLGLEHSCPWPRECLSSERLSLALASDFFCVLGLGLEPCVLDYTSEYLISDHRPLLVLINCMPSYTCQDNIDLHTNNFKHINWPTLISSKKVEYYQNTKLAMSAMPLPLNAISCQNPGCNDENHLESISQ